jgi:hypothetical protein
MELLEIQDVSRLQREQEGWIEHALSADDVARKDQWSQSIAVGSPVFVAGVREALGTKAGQRDIVLGEDATVLKEAMAPYKPIFDDKNSVLRVENTVYIDEYL